MSKLKYALAMLGAGGVVGMASEAAAETVALNIGWTEPTQDIALIAGEPAQFSYGFDGFKKSEFSPLANAFTGIITDTPGLPAPGETFDTVPVKTVKDFSIVGGSLEFLAVDRYIHLAFTTAGTNYIGTAYIDGGATLTEIVFEEGDYIGAPGAIPEPDAWALLIAGFGATGAMLRARRRTQAANA